MSNGHPLYEGFSSIWKEINSYSKLRVDENLCTKLNEYEEEITKFNVCLEEYNDVLDRYVVLEDATIRVLQKHLITSGRSIVLKSLYYRIES